MFYIALTTISILYIAIQIISLHFFTLSDIAQKFIRLFSISLYCACAIFFNNIWITFIAFILTSFLYLPVKNFIVKEK